MLIYKSHQEAALKFIRRVESRDIQASLWRESEELGSRFVNIRRSSPLLTKCSGFKHQMTNEFQPDLPMISAGGILADDMGLGKTLTMLSAIVLSADEAFCLNEFTPTASVLNELLQPTMATLVIVPSVREFSCTVHSGLENN